MNLLYFSSSYIAVIFMQMTMPLLIIIKFCCLHVLKGINKAEKELCVRKINYKEIV